MPDVDLVVNSFERTYRNVLTPGFFDRIAEENHFAFARRVAIVNNVDDRADATTRAESLLKNGEIDAYHFVEDHLEGALRVTGLSKEDLGSIPYFTDFAIVMVTLPGSPYLLHWDADVRLVEPMDWITPCLEVMRHDRRVLAANPNWQSATLERETIEDLGEIALTHGFSDQLFLGRRADFAAPIYGERCLARLRYPLAHIGHIFEARVDAHMRHHGRLRAIHRKAEYVHPLGGLSYPRLKLAEQARRARNKLVLEAIYASPWKPRCVRTI